MGFFARIWHAIGGVVDELNSFRGDLHEARMEFRKQLGLDSATVVVELPPPEAAATNGHTTRRPARVRT